MSVKAVVSIFCGGRGSTTIIRELLQHPDIKLNLLVNAYDDGLSTGELRQFIPGLLGASDFRKNIVNLLDFSSSNQSELNGFLCYIKDSSNYHFLSDELQSLFKNLESNLRLKLLEYLRFFLDYYSKQKKIFNFRDCSLGNILFAGAYLKNNQCFNDVIAELSTLFALQNKLINVTQGENRILVGLKENGEILDCEAKIVGKQSPAKIVDLFLLENHLTNDQREKISVLSLEKKWLEANDYPKRNSPLYFLATRQQKLRPLFEIVELASKPLSSILTMIATSSFLLSLI